MPSYAFDFLIELRCEKRTEVELLIIRVTSNQNTFQIFL